MASMLVAAIEQPKAAAGSIFNCVSDRVVTFDGLARMCAKAAGQTANIVHYDPSKIGIDAKKAFPFRNQVPLSFPYILATTANFIFNCSISTLNPELLRRSLDGNQVMICRRC